MHSLTRLIGYSLLLLLVFLGVTVGAQSWLRQQTQRLRVEAIESKRAQLLAVVEAMNGPLSQWDADFQRQLGTMIGGTVSVLPKPGMLSPKDSTLIYFDQQTGAGPTNGQFVRVGFLAPPMARLLAMYEKATIGLLLLAVALLMVGAFLAVLNWRSSEAMSAAPPTTMSGSSRAEMGSLEHLVKTSAAQGAELNQERDSRRLAEQDALLKEQLLNQSLEGKIRLGNDLHDGIIQSLYASGLTIESARALAKTNAAEADLLLAQCLQSLNATIRDVRNYITGLAPESLRRAGFAQAIESHITELGAGRTLKFDLKFDDDAIARLTPEQSNEALQVAREAISNSLRHGGASFVTVRLHQSDREVGLLVQDNGIGFDTARLERAGHGLGNMQKRAGRIGASVRVESQPGHGTRVILTLPLLTSFA
ncbi:MAG: sensor histidine kinase [Opitutaceae bacterium]